MNHIKKTYVIVYAFSIVHLLLGSQLFADNRHENKFIPTTTSHIQEAMRGVDEYRTVVGTKLLKFNEPLATVSKQSENFRFSAT
jgi:hypothetical protein